MAVGNNSLNRIAGSGQSRVIRAGEVFSEPVSHFVPREDTVIGTLEEQVVYNDAINNVSVLGSTVTLPNSTTVSGQNIAALTLVAGEIFVPRYGYFSKITPTSGSVTVYLLLGPREVDKKLNDNI
jgi:hypothetical protein